MATLWRGVRRCVSQRSRDPATYQLYLVTDDAFLDDQFYYKVEAAIRGGVTCLQLRLKNVSTSVYVSWAQKMRQLTQQHHIPLIVDDRLDVALAVEADGLHVGGDDLPWRTARRLLGSHRILGCSTYGRPELVSAALHPEVNADYLGSGAIFTTPTKASQAKGMEHLPLLRKQVASEGPVPIVAIGGVDLSSAADCVRSGADGVAVVRGILQSSGPEDSEAKAKALLAEVRSALEDRENEKVQRGFRGTISTKQLTSADLV